MISLVKKYKILIADDDKDIVIVLRQLLEAKGFSTFSAHEGVRAIEIAHKEKPDLIILDLKMPAGTGQSVLQTLRSRYETEKIPVMILSGHADEKVEIDIKKAGAQDFIRKPYEPEFLLQRVRSLLGLR